MKHPTADIRIKTLRAILAAWAITGMAAADGGGFFQAPVSPAIFSPGETVTTLTLGDMAVDEAQERIQAKVSVVPEGGLPSPLVVRVTGTLTVKAHPLRLPTATCLVFEKSGAIMAAPGATASELIRVEGATLVGISGTPTGPGTLKGSPSVGTAIAIVKSGRINIDRLVFKDFARTAISVQGLGDNRYAQAVSVTRSTLTGCGGGIAVVGSPQFIALDNRFQDMSAVAADLASPGAIIAGNVFERCQTALVASSKDLICTSNSFQTCHLGVDLRPGSELNFLEGNRFTGNTKAMAVDGTRNTLFGNSLAGGGTAPQVSVNGKENALMGNAGFPTTECLAPGNTFFHPPTTGNPHRDQVIFQGSRDSSPRGRFDLTIDGGKSMDAQIVQKTLDEARAAHPQDILVATLKGRFTTTTQEGLKVPDHTCVILDGELVNGVQTDETNRGGFEPRTSLISLQGKGCASLSGGRIFTETAVLDGVTAENSENALMIEGVSIDLSAPHMKMGSKSRNAITSKKHRGPMIVARNDIRDSGQRGVWGHVTSRLYVVGNTFTRSGMVMDFDAFCTHSAALFNSFTGTTYHSAIFFEEAVKFNVAFANRCTSNVSGLQVWNQEVNGTTAMNTIACNTLSGNGINLGVGGRATNLTATDNVFFNNRILGNTGRAGVNVKGFSSNNYFSQFVFEGNLTNVVDMSRKPAAPWLDGSTHTIFTLP